MATKPAEATRKPTIAARIEHQEQDHPPPESGQRRMPDKFRKCLLRVQGGKVYLPAAYRIVWFRDECPDWGVSTDLIEGGQEAGFATVRATITNPEGRVIATGHKTETRQDFPAGWVEKAETGSIARALAVVGFGTQFSLEMEEEVFADSPQSAGHMRKENRNSDDVWEGPGQCPRCHAPPGKRHGKPCASW